MQRRTVRCTPFLLLVACLAAGSAASLAADGPGDASAAVPRIEDRRLGEEEQILRRLEWFYGPRRAGTSSDAEMARLRRRAVERTRQAIEQSARRRALGLGEAANFWYATGPSPSHFGGWAFGDVAGRVPALAVDWTSGTVWAGSASGGLWRSTNDGLSWDEMLSGAGTQTVGAVELDPNDPDTIWVGTGENVQGCEGYFGIGMLVSTDGGLTWEQRNGTDGQTLEDLSSFASIVVDPRDSSHVVTGGRHRGCSSGASLLGGVYTTSDGGLHWTKSLGSLAVYEIQQDPQVLDVWWVATGQGIWKSTDNAMTWTKQTASGLPASDTGRTELAIAPSNGNVVYALFASGGSGNPEFWRTTDGGASWTLMSSGSDACDGQCWYNMTVAVDPANPDTVYRGTVHIFKSTDGGASWTDLSNNWGSSQKVHQDTHMLLMDPDTPGTFWVGCDGGVWKSTDGGATFLNRNGNMNLTQFYAVGVHPTDNGIICGGAQDNSSLARTTSDVWDLQAVTGDGFVCHVDPQNPDYAYIASYPSGGYPNVSRSETGILGSFHGITRSSNGIIGGDRINWVTPYVLDPTSPNILYLGTHRVYKSVNYGDWWDPVSGDLTNGSGSLVSLDVNRNFPEVVVASSTNATVWRTTDGGATWQNLSAGLPSRSINDVASDPVDPDRILAAVSGFGTAHLWEWRAGAGWTAVGDGLPNVPANTVLMLTDQKVYVGTDTGVFRSLDGGLTFEPFMNGLPEGLVIDDLKYNQSLDTITAGTYGRGAWQVQVDPLEPIVLYDSIELPMFEVDGDGDGSVEPGETWEVRPRLRNVGSQTASGVEATLATATPGVTIENGDRRAYGDIVAGAAAGAIERYRFAVSPSFPCGDTIVFDIVNITSTNAPGTYRDQPGAFTVRVLDHGDAPIRTTHLDDTLDPSPSANWTHEGYDPGLILCNLNYVDEWHLDSKDAAHGQSWLAGSGPGGSYARANYAWLYLEGRDSTNGPGIDIPADARTATLTLVHRYQIEFGNDGGQVVIDAVDDGQDVYEPLVPDGGYDTTIASNRCNGLEGQDAFSGDSGDWITSTFDLSAYVGRKVYIAFVFGSDSGANTQEGWWIDEVRIESEKDGPPICDTTEWPGEVPPTALFERLAGGDVQATWEASCNEAGLPDQTYAIEEGDLDALFSTRTWTHAPVAGRCDRLSPDTFTPGAGNRYWLITPTTGTREGSLGYGRPHADTTCGAPREGACP
ncbi:MAG: hypothetical protein D6738_12250 [Acidobacteria bacterium]|nr:MAG: hypothetical protein D6738_12250 [Acidobacteriota bacterium]